ncbi:MAG: serine hydrolase [Eubacteriales bacterium]|nr:serine hydrolase [Eubacteriales bacterium]
MSRKKVLQISLAVLIVLNLLLIVACIAIDKPSENSANEAQFEVNTELAIEAETTDTKGNDDLKSASQVKTDETEPKSSQEKIQLDQVSASWPMADPAVSLNSVTTQGLASALQSYLNAKGLTAAQVGIAYENLVTHERLELNAENRYIAASTVKVPIGMVFYQMIHEGSLPEDLKIAYKDCEFFYEDGFTLAPEGTLLPLDLLVENAVVHSGNTATSALFNFFKEEDKYLHNYLDSRLGMHYASDMTISAREAMRVLEELYYNNQNVAGYAKILDYMKRSTWSFFSKAKVSDVLIASKYGLLEENMHDIGIVYREEPYAFAVLTNSGTGYECIADIVWIMDQWHQYGSVDLTQLPASNLPGPAQDSPSYEEYYENTEYPQATETTVESTESQTEETTTAVVETSRQTYPNTEESWSDYRDYLNPTQSIPHYDPDDLARPNVPGRPDSKDDKYLP